MVRSVTVRQRRAFKGPRLRSKRLTPEERFRLFLELLRTYARQHGHARVPVGHREGNVPLGYWVGRMRRAYLTEDLSPERIRILERIPGWSWSPRDDQFRRGLQFLCLFLAREGHTRVPMRHHEAGFPLWNWTWRKRLDYSSGRLSDAHVRALDAIRRWTWRPKDDRLETALAALRRFRQREGHCDVPARHREGKVSLGRWLVGVRYRRRRGELPREQVRALEAITGWSWGPPRGARKADSSWLSVATFVTAPGSAKART